MSGLRFGTRLLAGFKWFFGLGLATLITGVLGYITTNVGKQADRGNQQCALATQIVTADHLNAALPVAMSRRLVENAVTRANARIKKGVS